MTPEEQTDADAKAAAALNALDVDQHAQSDLASDPNANPAPAGGTVAASEDNAGSTIGVQLQGSVANGGATPGDVTSEINPSNALAGTSGATPGTNLTGMAAGATPPRTASTQPAGDGTQPPLPGLPVDTANVNVTVTAPHPIVHATGSLVAELHAIIDSIEKSPPILRAEKLLIECQEWIVQHFEDVKRKG